MDTLGPMDEISRDIEDLVRRIDRHRTMLLQLADAQSQALGELKGLVRRAEGQAAGAMSLPEIDEEIRTTELVRRIVAGTAGLRARATPKVLLIDDDPTTRNLISHFLRKEDFLVEKAAGGSDGLARARDGKLDLVIIDAAVPGMGGFEVLSHLKKDPETAGIPALMLSSLDEEETIVKSLEEGANYLIKPFSPRVLVAKVKKILKDAGAHALDHRRL